MKIYFNYRFANSHTIIGLSNLTFLRILSEIQLNGHQITDTNVNMTDTSITNEAF